MTVVQLGGKAQLAADGAIETQASEETADARAAEWPRSLAASVDSVSEEPVGDFQLEDQVKEMPDADAVTFTSPDIAIAGTTIHNPAAVIARYLQDHATTVEKYDKAAGTFAEINSDLIARTRRPYMSSRISKTQEEWFIERAKTAPWHLVPRGTSLRAVDPTVQGGLSDAVDTLWFHFRSDAPRGVAGAKISKVLHLMYPNLVPILDSRLARLYERSAREAMKHLRAVRPEYHKGKWAYWEAIRLDLIGAESQFQVVREEIRSKDLTGVSDVVDRISDLRLLDMLAWTRKTSKPITTTSEEVERSG